MPPVSNDNSSERDSSTGCEFESRQSQVSNDNRSDSTGHEFEPRRSHTDSGSLELSVGDGTVKVEHDWVTSDTFCVIKMTRRS